MEEQNERQVKGIWIPIEIWKDKNLTWNEKILFLEIDSYTSKDKDCYFSNEYISELLGISVTNASKTISSLIEKGYIVKTKFDGRKRYVKSALSYSTSLNCQKQQTSHAHAIDIINNNIDLINKNNKEEDTNVSPKKNDYQVIVDCWNEYNGAKLGKVMKLTEMRKKSIRRVMGDNDITQEQLMTFFKALPYADSWLYNPNKQHRNWKPDFDWWMANTNGWLTKALEGKVHNENPKAFERIMKDGTFSSQSVMYLPQGRNIWFEESTQSYWSMDSFYDEHIYDGYTDDERPDGAEITLNNARGTYKWNSNNKKWEKK